MQARRFVGGALLVLITLFSHSNAAIAQAMMNIAVAQLQTSDVGNFEKIRSLAAQAKAQGADLIIFPEDAVFGWLNPAVFTQAAPIPGVYSDKFASIAQETGIWVAAGLAEKGPKAGPGSQSNAYEAYDSGILINPQGTIVLHHRKFEVLSNAFDPDACKAILGQAQCSYTPGDLSDIVTADTPFGKTALLVCADAYTYGTSQALAKLKPLKPDLLIVPWGITAASAEQCGASGFNATAYSSDAANYLKSAFVIGANAVGVRNYGRFLPSQYCGTSGYATPTGQGTEAPLPQQELVIFKINRSFDANAGPIWSNTDAPGKCPQVCSGYDAQWTGQWTTTVPGQMSVCGCAKHMPPAKHIQPTKH